MRTLTVTIKLTPTLFYVLAFLFAGPAHAELVDGLARTPAVIDAKISPLGEYLAVLKEQDAQRVVAVFEFPDMKLVNLVDFPGRAEVANYWWVNERRLLFTVALDWGNRPDDSGYGQLYAVDATGKDGRYLDVARDEPSDQAEGGNSDAATEYVSATLAAELWDDPEHVLIRPGHADAAAGLVKLNVYTGAQSAAIFQPQAAAVIATGPEADDLSAGLQQVFPNGKPLVVSASRDDRLAIVRLAQDSRTPEFYLYERSTSQLRLLFDAMPWIDDELLPTTQPVTVVLREGVSLTGYLSIPEGVEANDLPLIVIAQTSPVRRGLNRASFVAAAGYATLQMNADREAAHLVDATRWAIEQGIADPERICIFGWGAGGHLALTAVLRDSKLFQCAVAGAGVFRDGEAFSVEVLAPASAGEIVVPLLLVHGDDDQLAPIEQVYALQAAVKQADGPAPELLVLADAPHHPRTEDHIRRWYRASIEFFAQHVGPGVEPRSPRRLLIAEPPVP